MEERIDLAGLYGDASFPTTHVQAYKDFRGFVDLGWLTLEQRFDFMKACDRTGLLREQVAS